MGGGGVFPCSNTARHRHIIMHQFTIIHAYTITHTLAINDCYTLTHHYAILDAYPPPSPRKNNLLSQQQWVSFPQFMGLYPCSRKGVTHRSLYTTTRPCEQPVWSPTRSHLPSRRLAVALVIEHVPG